MTVPFNTFITSFDTLTDYLEICTPLALAHSVHGRDFHSPVYGSYAEDESAYTKEERIPFYTTIFGRVSSPVKWKDWHRTFRIDGGDTTAAGVHEAFSRQTDCLAGAVKNDDVEDVKQKENPEVFVWSDASRVTATGATYLEVHVDHLSGCRCVLRELVDGEVNVRVPVVDEDWPLKIGDWVIMTATLHRMETRSHPHYRSYEVLARDLQIIDVSGAHDLVRLFECAVPREGDSLRLTGAEVPSSESPPLLSPVAMSAAIPSVAAPKSPEPVVTRSRTRKAKDLGDAEADTKAAEPAVTRSRARQASQLGDADSEVNPVAETPRKKRKVGSARMSTGGRAPR